MGIIWRAVGVKRKDITVGVICSSVIGGGFVVSNPGKVIWQAMAVDVMIIDRIIDLCFFDLGDMVLYIGYAQF